MKAEDVLQEIIDCARSENDKAVFGERVAEILRNYNLIPEAVYEILKGE